MDGSVIDGVAPTDPMNPALGFEETLGELPCELKGRAWWDLRAGGENMGEKGRGMLSSESRVCKD